MNSDFTASQPNAIVAAVSWVQSALVGSLAVTIAVIAVGWFGLMLMTGRLRGRRGAQLILGCFVIFGASSIAAGIVQRLGVEREPIIAPPTPLRPMMTEAPQYASPAVPDDPFARAAVPRRR